MSRRMPHRPAPDDRASTDARRRWLVALAAFAAPWSGAAWARDTLRQARDVAGFRAIDLRGPFDLVVRPGAVDRVTVEAAADVIDRIATRVEPGRDGVPTLVVAPAGTAPLQLRSAVRVEVEARRIEAVDASGSGLVRIEDLSVPALALRMAGSGDLRVHRVTTPALTLSLAGSGDAVADGSVQRLRLSVAGSAEVDARALRADAVRVEIAGSGDVRVQAGRTLDVTIAGSGDVEYDGDPALTTSILGSGRVRKRR